MKVKRLRIVIGIIVIVAIIGIIAVVLVTQRVSHQTNTTSSSTEAPVYQTVLPKGKTISTLGGWQRISPPGSDPVFAYTDSVQGVSVSVSEQPLPASFKANTNDQIAELAKGYNATDTVTAGKTTVYIGTNVKGPQSVIFTKDTLLILIKSEEKIADAAWVSYISQLN